MGYGLGIPLSAGAKPRAIVDDLDVPIVDPQALIVHPLEIGTYPAELLAAVLDRHPTVLPLPVAPFPRPNDRSSDVSLVDKVPNTLPQLKRPAIRNKTFGFP
jgi:hypothetical protein